MVDKITKEVFGTRLGKKNKKITKNLGRVDPKIANLMGINKIGK